MSPKYFPILIVVLCIIGCSKDDLPTYGSFTDGRDGNVYKSVKIGHQVWMAENLAWLPYLGRNSSGSAAEYLVYGYWDQSGYVPGAKESANYKTYGVLYNWPSAIDACPAGWHLPTDEEWKTLEKYTGMTKVGSNTLSMRYSGSVGAKLKESGTSHWFNLNTSSDNSTGFTALPGGYHDTELGQSFNNIGAGATFWSATEANAFCAWMRYLSGNSAGIGRGDDFKRRGFSIRCIRD